MTQEILALCRAMGAAADQEELLLPLILAAKGRLTGRLKEGTAPEDCGTAFPLATAMVVMERLSAMTGGGSAGEVTSFTAGDLTVRRESGGGGPGKSLSAQAEELLTPWLADDGFIFQGVEG